MWIIENVSCIVRSQLTVFDIVCVSLTLHLIPVSLIVVSVIVHASSIPFFRFNKLVELVCVTYKQTQWRTNVKNVPEME